MQCLTSSGSLHVVYAMIVCFPYWQHTKIKHTMPKKHEKEKGTRLEDSSPLEIYLMYSFVQRALTVSSRDMCDKLVKVCLLMFGVCMKAKPGIFISQMLHSMVCCLQWNLSEQTESQLFFTGFWNVDTSIFWIRDMKSHPNPKGVQTILNHFFLCFLSVESFELVQRYL